MMSIIMDSAVAMADGMRAEGKIYVVVLVVAILVVGMLIYLINLDRKITKAEKSIGAEKQA